MRHAPRQEQRAHSIGARFRRPRHVSAALGVAAVIPLIAASPARAVIVLSTAPNTTVTLGLSFSDLEFENPLAGSETIQGYRVIQWRDADYQPALPNRYDDWSNAGSGAPDGNTNEVWMRGAGQAIMTTTSVVGTVVSIHLNGDNNDGLADVFVDGVRVAQLDMGTSSGSERAFVLVTGLPAAAHQIEVVDQGSGQLGDDVAVLGAAVLANSSLLGPTLEFSIDIGSDSELSDPIDGQDGGFDPGDVYAWRSAPISAPNGRDGFKDDAAIFAGIDIWPDPPDTFPPTTNVPMVDGYGPDDYGTNWFDLDGHDQLDFYLGELMNGVDPLLAPLYYDNLFFPQPSACVFKPLYMLISYDDDIDVGWPNPDAPTLSSSPAGTVYGTTALQDEILAVTVLTPGSPPLSVGTAPLLDEIGLHQSLAPNPDNGDADDDDVDSLDLVQTLETCPVWLFSPDHEAYSSYVDINTGQPLDPGGIYEQLAAGPYKVIDEAVHLGLPEDTDIDAFEFVWIPDPDAGGALALALVFSVDENDPLTSVPPWNQDESGGRDPKMLYYSFMTGSSAPLLVNPLDDDIDAVANWPEPFDPGQEEEFVKWSQPPTINPDIDPLYFYGWNEWSVFGNTEIVASDWACFDDRPITDIHWWGSYIGWDDPTGPPPVVPQAFHIGVWTDVPKPDPTDPASWSHPGTMIWEWRVPYDQTNERWVNFDTYPGQFDSCFMYDFYIPPLEWFWQEPGEPHVYWLSISAIYAACACNLDIDGNGVPADLPDIVIMTACVIQGDCSGCVNSCDVNCDGVIDVLDLAALQNCSTGACDCTTPGSTACCPNSGTGTPTDYVWGWKTRRPVWNDAAVAIATPTAPIVGAAFLEGFPLVAPDDQWDMAFVLTSDQEAQPQACCQPDGTCTDSLPASCLAAGGTPQGLGTACSTTIWCVQPDGTCRLTDPLCCDDLGGTPAQPGETPNVDCQDGLDNDCDGAIDCQDSDCSTDPACQAEACCSLTDGSCSYIAASTCTAQGGVPQGSGSTCSATLITCLLPTGACLQTDPICCDDLGGTPAAAAETPNVDCQDGLDNDCDGFIDCNDHPDCDSDPACQPPKWIQLPDLDVTGIDVYGTQQFDFPVILAEDFLCTTTGPITEVAFWSSWYFDIFPHGDPQFVGFHLSFHDDIPANESPTGYSMPGQLLWEWEFPIGACFIEDIIQPLQEGFMWPPEQYEPFGDTVCFKYRCLLDEANAFWQLGTPDAPRVYWLDVQALTDDPQAHWGWKTSVDHWNDDAVWAIGPPYDPEPQWIELRYPPGHPWIPQSIDLAFELVGREEQPPIGACCLPDENCLVTDAADCENNLHGTFMGAGTTCGAQGSCCYDGDGNGSPETCTVSYEICCNAKGGIFTAGDTCDPIGACCYTATGGSWTCEQMAATCCAALPNSAFHSGEPCGEQGVCCYDTTGDSINDTCAELPEACCADFNGSFTPGATCTGSQACCFTDSSCLDLDPVCCADAGGSPQGVGTDCATTTCGPPEACCLPDGSCTQTTYLTNQCADLGGDPQGPNTDCANVTCSPIKWSQPPRFDPQSPHPECYWGWDEPSIYGYEQIAADDWGCQTERPVTDIHWWGSYIGWDGAAPPEPAPTAFHIGIWTDVAVGTGQEEYSHPGKLIWEWKVDRDQLRERPVACDYYPPAMPQGAREGCFRYDFDIPVVDWFYQGPECNVYWLSIAAVYAEQVCACNGDLDGNGVVDFPDLAVLVNCIAGDCSGCVNTCDLNCDGVIDPLDSNALQCLVMGGFDCCPNSFVPEFPWGWKTHRPEWNDDAVRITMPTSPSLDPPRDEYQAGLPIETVDGSWDLSFVLTTHEGLMPPKPVRPVRGKSRYLSIVPGNPGSSVAIRVKCTSLSGYSSWDNTTRWVGIPAPYPDENSAMPGLTIDASLLECDPVFRDWSADGVVHIYGGEIVPLSTYEIQTVDASCPDLSDESCYSPPLVLHTGTWGDAVVPFADPLGPVQPDFTDISAIVDKFLASPTAPSKPSAQLQPNTPFPERPIDFRDISACVDSFLGILYSSSYPGPCTCPSSVTCGTSCTSDTDCGGLGYCRGGECRDFCHRCTP